VSNLQRLMVITSLAVLVSMSPVFAGDDNTAVFTSLLDAPRASDDVFEEDRIASTAFLLEQKAIPILEKALSLPDEEKAYLAGRALAVIGGEQAIAVLRKKCEETKNNWIKSLLCFALASRGKPEDVKYLIDSLQGEHIGDEGAPILSAAYSLGVLKAEQARGPLQQTVEKNSGFASEAARTALQWMDQKPWQTPQAVSAEGKDGGILTLFRFGIPRSDEADVFIERNTQRIWQRRERSWSYHNGPAPQKETPSIWFNVRISPDGARAFCSVGLLFGPLNGSGYDFVLRKVEGEWRVVGVALTWVS
jgi:hypothetical protein